MNISPTHRYQYWQNQILDQLGIVRWVDFHTPIIELDINELEKSLDLAVSPIIHEHEIADDTTSDYEAELQTAISEITPDDSYFDELIYLDTLEKNATTVVDFLDNTTDNQAVETANIGIVIDKFHLQMAVFENWIIVADLAVLQHHAEQQSLWQNLLNHLHLTPHDFVFPIVTQNLSYNLNQSDQQMCTDILASAFFDGKICALSQEQPRQIGMVTALPTVLQNKQIHHFPSLASMLNDFQQKRAFWHQLKGVH